MDVSDSDDLYEVFDQPLSPETSPGDLGQTSQPLPNHFEGVASSEDEMGIQRKPRSTFQKLLESQPGRHAPTKAPQTRLPTPPPHLPNLSELIQLTRRGKGMIKERRWWKEGRTCLHEKPSTKGRPSSLGQCKRGQPLREIKRLITKLQPPSGPHEWRWMELPSWRMPPPETSSRVQLGIWRMQWSNPYYCPRTWLTSGLWGSMKSSLDWRVI